jgi:hypothetical protein
MKRLFSPHVAAFALLLLGSVPARADLINWSFSWDRSVPAVLAGTGGVSLTGETITSAVGDSDVVASNLRVFSTAPPKSPDTFGPNDGHYAVTITLTDAATGTSGSLTFTGQLQGTFSSDSAGVSNTFTGLTTQKITLGNTLFTVTMTGYTAPGPPTATKAGSIGAFVHVESAQGEEQHLPEPSTMLLAGLGAGVAGLAGWRKRRRRG